jgi:hypothetical protein
MDIRSRFCFTSAMRARLQRALLAFAFALSFILNGSVMQAVHAHKPAPSAAMSMTGSAMPCNDAGNAEKHHPCCPQQDHEKASCTADCCTSVMPATVQANTRFTFVTYKQRPRPAVALLGRILGPPPQPPKA